MSQKNKHIPQRTCVACRQRANKKELIRLVHTDKELVEIDTSDRKLGRGAYLCPTRSCWAIGLERNYLERALRVKLSANNRRALINYSDNLSKENQL